MTQTSDLVFIVDDDASIRDALSLLLSLHGFNTRSFASAETFLQNVAKNSGGCVILDRRLPDGDGLEVLEKLKRDAFALPVIMLTAYGDVATARKALRSGAADFLEKPVDDQLLLSSIKEAMHISPESKPTRAKSEQALERLTAREQEVLNFLLEGATTREMADVLQISVRTVEAHRANIMEKFGVKRVPDLLRVVLQGGQSGFTGSR